MSIVKTHIPYSCLMSVYYGETESNLKRSMRSIFDQTVPPSEFVLVCDGPLHSDLEKVIEDFEKEYPLVIKRISISLSKGLWNALGKGIEACTNDLIMRMDSDDWSVPTRAEKQLNQFQKIQNLDCCGSLVAEFSENINNCVSQVSLPETHNEICKFSKNRIPVRHPALMYKKHSVIKSGGYQEKPFFEDYDLVLRMISHGCVFYNIQENLVYMQVSDDFYERRGNLSYLKNMLHFRYSALKRGDIGLSNFIYATAAHSIVCLLPNKLRSSIYCRFLRKDNPR